MLVHFPERIWYWCRRCQDMKWMLLVDKQYVCHRAPGHRLNPANLLVVYSVDEFSKPARVLLPSHTLTGEYPAPAPLPEEPDLESWEDVITEFDE